MAVDILMSSVFKSVGDFLVAVLGCEVIQTQENRVPMPIDGFVGMTNVYNRRLATNLAAYTSNSESFKQKTEVCIQLDFYGPNSADWQQAITTLLRSDYACRFFPANIVPLYCDDAKQMPIVNGENQYETRWSLDIHLQYNPTITTAVQTANAASATVIEVDTTYPPS